MELILASRGRGGRKIVGERERQTREGGRREAGCRRRLSLILSLL